jgi:hypothetical protein
MYLSEVFHPIILYSVCKSIDAARSYSIISDEFIKIFLSISIYHTGPNCKVLELVRFDILPQTVHLPVTPMKILARKMG